MKKKTDKCENEYKGSVGMLIQTQDRFYDNDMPDLLRDFELHDEKRIELTKDFFIEFFAIFSLLLVLMFQHLMKDYLNLSKK